MSLGKRVLFPPDFIFKTAYSTNERVAISFPEKSPYTKQEFKDECDINILMSRYLQTGEIPDVSDRAPQYLDVSASGDFREAMEFVAGARTLFFEMPSKIRSQFDNDPALFVDFCSHEKNRPEMEEMGLLKPKAEWVNTMTASPPQNALQGNSGAPAVPPAAAPSAAAPPTSD